MTGSDKKHEMDFVKALAIYKEYLSQREPMTGLPEKNSFGEWLIYRIHDQANQRTHQSI